MKALLLALLALGSGTTAALGILPNDAPDPAPHPGSAAALGHEAAPRGSWQRFPLTLDATSLGPAGVHDVGEGDCVEVRTEGGPADILGGHATLAAEDARSPGARRLRLEAAAPSAVAGAAGALPLTLEIGHVEMRGSGSVLRIGAALPEGALAVAIEQRLVLTLALEHVGAPLAFSVEDC